MAKELTYKLKLKVDGKDVVKKLTVDMDELVEPSTLRESLLTNFATPL